jgi:hypothetical protein
LGDFRIIGRKDMFIDGEGALEMLLRSFEVTLVSKEHAEMSMDKCNIGMIGRKGVLGNGKGTLEILLRSFEVTLFLEEHTEVVEAGGNIGMIGG